MIDTMENNASRTKEKIRPRIAMAASWEIRHREMPHSFFRVCVGGFYSCMCLIESALFHNDV